MADFLPFSRAAFDDTGRARGGLEAGVDWPSGWCWGRPLGFVGSRRGCRAPELTWLVPRPYLRGQQAWPRPANGLLLIKKEMLNNCSSARERAPVSPPCIHLTSSVATTDGGLSLGAEPAITLGVLGLGYLHCILAKLIGVKASLELVQLKVLLYPNRFGV